MPLEMFFMYFRICINRLGNIIKDYSIFLRVRNMLDLDYDFFLSYSMFMLDLDYDFFLSYSMFVKNLKVAIDIWQGTAILKLRTVYTIIRKDTLQKFTERRSCNTDSEIFLFGRNSIALTIRLIVQIL